jgi:anti-sigma regulatory factor (Ser/Thr protein kinase)
VRRAQPTRSLRTAHPATLAVPHRGNPPGRASDSMSVAVRVFPGHPQQVAPARRWAAALAAAHGASPGDARLITSELVTNAIVHSRSSQRGGTLTVAITTEPGQITIHVHDLGTGNAGNALPAPRPVNISGAGLAEGHRGLWIVTALGTEWGTRPAAHCPATRPGDPAAVSGGCCTWCTLACQPHQHDGEQTAPG